MADTAPQSFKNHTKFVPLFHFVVLPILLINLGWRIWRLYFFIAEKGHERFEPTVNLLLALAFMGIAFTARTFALQAQDRVIRLEELIRLKRVLPDALASRVGEIGRRELIALRFAPDAELPGLVARVLSGDLKEPKAIKQEIKAWRADHHRL